MTTGTDALQALLAAEHAVIYGYGVAGARLSGREQRRADRLWHTHQQQRDQLAGLIRDRGAEPVQTAAAYRLPAPVRSAKDARSLAAGLEERFAAVWADAVQQLSGDLRDVAVEGLQRAAVAAALWRGTSVPFPGLPERST